MSYFPTLAQRQAEAAETNRKLVTSLNRRMFRGFTKIKKLKEMKETPNKNKIIQVTNKWEQYTPMPFEDNYNITYKDTYLNKLKGKQINSFDIINLNPHYNFEKQKNKTIKNKQKSKNNIFLTYNNIYNSNNNNINDNQKNKIQVKIIDESSKDEEEKKILKKIFPDEEEMKVITDLPFFSLVKNPLRSVSVESKKKYNEKEKKILTEEFLYKLSHKHPDEKYSTLNKGIVRGFRTAYNEFGEKNNSVHKAPKKLELNVENVFSNEKISQLNPVERHLQRIENNLNLIKTLPENMFKDFADDFMNDDDYNDDDNLDKYINKRKSDNEDKKKEDEKIITFDATVFEEKKRQLLNRKYAQTLQTYYNPNSPKLYYGDYLNQQLKNKAERFEIIHKIAFEDFIKRKNSNLHDPKIPSKSIKINPDSRLLIKKKLTNKGLYDIESKTRDIIIANKLKTEYSPQDVNRILNGFRPWNEEEK